MASDMQIIRWGAQITRKVPKLGKRCVFAIKSLASFSLTQILHEKAIHRMRDYSFAVKEEKWMDGGQNAIEMCSSMRELMGKLTELNPDEIHCCLKGFMPNNTTDLHDHVVTVARSEPFGNRPIDPKTFDSHLVEENTVWASLMGKSDGKYNWQRIKVRF